jgi:uncharacterized DUF497 family protein
VRFDWDSQKDRENGRKHGLRFSEVVSLFTSGVEYLEVYDEEHSGREDRFIAIGPAERGVVVVVWTEKPEGTVRIISARNATEGEIELFFEHVGS